MVDHGRHSHSCALATSVTGWAFAAHPLSMGGAFIVLVRVTVQFLRTLTLSLEKKLFLFPNPKPGKRQYSAVSYSSTIELYNSTTVAQKAHVMPLLHTTR